MSGPENRKEPRIPHGTEVQIENDGEFVEKFSGNISRGGIYVKTPRPLPVGREVILKVALAGGGYLEVEGTVAWSRTDEDPATGEPPGMGIKFKQLGPGIEVLVDRVVTAGESRTSGGDGNIRLLLTQLRRNRKGETVREGRMIYAPAISIGRASDKEIHLADPRVALDHAVIRARSFGVLGLESAGPDLRVNGSYCQSADLAIGMQIEIGSFVLVVETPGAEGSPEHDLALTIERVQPVDEPETRKKKREAATTLAGAGLSMRRPAVLLALLIGLSLLLLPALQASSPVARATLREAGIRPAKAWNPGALASGHRSFAEECETCHAKAFAFVQDEQCLKCHATVRDHIRNASLNASVMGATRCADCHRDHRGPRSMEERDPKLCVDCHGKLAESHPEAKQRDISSFTTNHPAFSLSLPSGRNPGEIVRVSQEDPAAKIWDDGLHFPHDIHLAKEGIRSPDAPGGKAVMQCADCHELEAGRHFYKPVEMKKHCAKCHRLDFEPGRTSRQVPHGSVEGVLTTLREFYAGVALGAVPMAESAPRPMMIGRPGEKRRPEAKFDAVASVQWVNASAQAAAFELFEKRACHDCHEIERVDAAPGDPAGILGQSWRVKRVMQVDRWLPKSDFEHSRHASEKCERCHAAQTSKLATDVLMPTIGVCRECHVAEPQPDKVTSGCETCHGYHGHSASTLAAAGP